MKRKAHAEIVLYADLDGMISFFEALRLSLSCYAHQRLAKSRGSPGFDDSCAPSQSAQIAADVFSCSVWLSIGVEHVEDILADLDQALATV